jgi:hypothetical protein
MPPEKTMPPEKIGLGCQTFQTIVFIRIILHVMPMGAGRFGE